MAYPILIAGSQGRMGQVLIEMASRDENYALLGGIGKQADFTLESAPFSRAKAVIDFSAPALTLAIAQKLAEEKTDCAHIIGTTGFSESEEAEIKKHAHHITIIKEGNMSMGVNVLAALVSQAAKLLPDWDMEILDRHHRHKKDAPSGTAKLLAEAAGRKTAISSMRAGEIIGEHEVMLAGHGESLALIHRAEARDIFAKGALKAALWAKGKKAGLYGMSDVLGLTP